MDQLAKQTASGATKVRRAAQEAGIGPMDPLSGWVEAVAGATEDVAAIPDEIERRIAPLLDEVRALIQAAEKSAGSATLTNEQVDQISRKLVKGCSAWASRMVRAANIRSVAIGVAALVGVASAGFAGGYFWRGAPPATACQAHDGGIACSYWLQPPTK